MPSSRRHGWHRWDGYQAVHYGYLTGYRPHFLLEDKLPPIFTPRGVTWNGVLVFVDGLELAVKKDQEVEYRSGGPYVRTVRYAYQFLRQQEGHRIGIFRYDNFHAHAGHGDPHHYHRYDDTGAPIEPPEHIGEARWPTLSDVIAQTYQWWCDHPMPSQ